MIKIFKAVFLIFPALVLLTTLRGVGGNPTPREIMQMRSETKPFELSPERGRYALTMSMAENKSFYFTREIAEYVVPDLGYINGKYVSLFAPGVSFIAFPFYILGRYFNHAQLFTFALSGIFALLNVILIAAITKKFTQNWFAGLVGGLTFLFGSSAWPYATTLYQHHVTAFLLLGAFYLLGSDRPQIFTSFLVGVLFGLSIFVEYPNAIFFIPIIILLLYRHVIIEDRYNSLKISIKTSLFLGILGLSMALFPSLWYNSIAYGNPLQLAGTVTPVREISSQGQEIITSDRDGSATVPLNFFGINDLPNSMNVLLTSKERGILWFSPVLLLSILGISPLYKKYKEFSLTLLGSLGVILFLYGTWGDPWGGWAFGPRYLIPFFSILSIYLSVAVSVYSKKIWFSIAFITTLIYSVIVNLSGALTTLQIPPSVEIDSLRYPAIRYIYNIELLMNGKSSSFVFNSFVNQFISLKYFAVLLLIMVVVLVLSSYFISIKQAKQDI